MYDNTRSMHSIRTNTSIISRFPFKTKEVEDRVEVRCMLSRRSAERQHFIVTLEKEVQEALKISNSTINIIPFFEVVFRQKTVLFISEPLEKIKTLNEEEERDLKKQVCLIIEKYMAENFN